MEKVKGLLFEVTISDKLLEQMKGKKEFFIKI